MKGLVIHTYLSDEEQYQERIKQIASTGLSGLIEQEEKMDYFKKGDRVRIKEGYKYPGLVVFYRCKSLVDVNMVMVYDPDGVKYDILAEAIEPYPYTREEHIERAIEDFWTALALAVDREKCLSVDDRALLFAIIDREVSGPCMDVE